MDAPPPPPPAGGDAVAQPMELPPHLQAMMREVQANWGGAQHRSRHSRQPNDSFQGRHQGGSNGYGRGGGRGGSHGRGRGRGGNRGGRGGGRGGRGGYGHPQANQQGYGQFKRKRDEEGSGVLRFFLPSFLDDPWASLLHGHSVSVARREQQHDQQLQHPAEHEGRQDQRPGRVLFQPSFLMDPWAALLR